MVLTPHLLITPGHRSFLEMIIYQFWPRIQVFVLPAHILLVCVLTTSSGVYLTTSLIYYGKVHLSILALDSSFCVACTYIIGMCVDDVVGCSSDDVVVCYSDDVDGFMYVLLTANALYSLSPVVCLLIFDSNYIFTAVYGSSAADYTIAMTTAHVCSHTYTPYNVVIHHVLSINTLV